LTFGLLLLISAALVRCQDNRSPTLLSLPITTLTLQNGMRVAVHEDHKVPLVKVMISVGVGSADEPPGRAGFAHLFEHLMFMGTEAVPNFDRVMEELGATNNAWTDYDETVYYSAGPSNTWSTLLWMEADRFANIPAAMTDAKLNLQREVVLNELRQNVLDTPGAAADELQGDALFPDGHPYERPVIGSIADIEAARTPEVIDFFARYYRPSNLVMTITGDVKTADVLAQVEASFSRIQDRPVAYQPREIAKRDCGPCQQEQGFTDAVTEPRINISWAWPTERTLGSIVDPHLELVAIMLNDELSSPIQQRVVRSKKLATSLSVGYSGYEHAQFLTLSADAAPGITANALRNELLAAMDEARRIGFRRSDVFNAQMSAETLAIEFETSNGKADVLAEVIRRYGSVNSFGRYRDRFLPVDERTTTASLRAALETADRVVQIVKPGDRTDYPRLLTTSTGKPTGTLMRGPNQIQFQRPRATKPSPIDVAQPETVTLRNGMKLRWFQRDDAPRVRVRLVLPGGFAQDPPGRTSQSELLAGVVTRGAGSRDAPAFADALENMGSDLSVASYLNDYSIGLSATVDSLDETLDLLSDVLRTPRIDQREVELLREQTIASIQQSVLDADAMASYAIYDSFFPETHPTPLWQTSNASPLST
jgi:zinc protease